jgi:hypothetical protein
MAFCLLLTATHDFKTSPVRSLVGLSAKYRYSKGRRCRLVAKKSKSNR